MKQIKVLGSGCTKCVKTAELISEVVNELGVEATVSKETSPEAIMGYGVMRTPAVVIDEQVVHSGSMPEKAQIESWLA
ncbi:thioredoxin family protein [Shewanella avicenniae]|uniref:Thioredoxin family protein n=1 Tax=Shewanella avicenniae TaxID=2814294 RepID=A0ABX7QPL0_9GAMM|nr:thioredoxin family protein [Shewanella avicenniae]QSX33339.1 thioredoxin family protein [Shewanella avicenniae]